MSKRVYLTPEEVEERYRGAVKVRTLANWRVQKVGPRFRKIGKAVLYDESDLNDWDDRQSGMRVRK